MVGIFLVCIPIAMKSAELEALLVSDFGPKISFRIVDTLCDEICDGKLKSGTEIKVSLKRCILKLLTTKGSKTELQLDFRKPAVIMIVGVNGGGKMTLLGNVMDEIVLDGSDLLALEAARPPLPRASPTPATSQQVPAPCSSFLSSSNG